MLKCIQNLFQDYFQMCKLLFNYNTTYIIGKLWAQLSKHINVKLCVLGIQTINWSRDSDFPFQQIWNSISTCLKNGKFCFIIDLYEKWQFNSHKTSYKYYVHCFGAICVLFSSLYLISVLHFMFFQSKSENL